MITRQRFIKPYQWVLAATSVANTVGRVYLELFEVPEGTTVDAIIFIKGAVQAGNVRVGIYGPVVTEEIAAGTDLVVESADTAVSAGTNTAQIVPLTATRLRKGRYYAAIEFSNVTNEHMRYGNQRQVVGFTYYYDRASGYGALTTPCPATTDSASAFPAIHIRTTE